MYYGLLLFMWQIEFLFFSSALCRLRFVHVTYCSEAGALTAGVSADRKL